MVKKILPILSIILWVVTIGIFINAFMHHDLWGLTPIIAHNRIHGIFGWSLILSIVFSILWVIVRHKK